MAKVDKVKMSKVGVALSKDILSLKNKYGVNWDEFILMTTIVSKNNKDTNDKKEDNK